MYLLSFWTKNPQRAFQLVLKLSKAVNFAIIDLACVIVRLEEKKRISQRFNFIKRGEEMKEAKKIILGIVCVEVLKKKLCKATFAFNH